MSAVAAVRLEDAERETLRALADVLIPGGEAMPSASDVGVAGKWIDRTLRARPDLTAPLLAIVRSAAGGKDPAAEIGRARVADPTAFELFALAVSGAYLLSPKAKKALRYPGPRRNRAYPDEAEHYLADGLIEPVVQRGPIYRPTPSSNELPGARLP
jgi:hypothetical protein